MRWTIAPSVRARVAAQVVVAQRQLVDALEQHRQPVGDAPTGVANGSSPASSASSCSSRAQKPWKVVTASSS